MASANDILKTINDAVDKLSNAAQIKQNPLFRDVVNQLQKLQLKNGALLNNIANLKAINRIKTTVEKLIIDPKYKDQLKDFVNTYKQVADLQNDYFSQFASFKPKAALNVLRNSAIDATLTNLTETGIETGVTDGLKKILTTNVQQGGSMADLTEQLREYMLTTDKTGDGALLKYVRGYATTAINQFSAEYNKSIADDLGLEWYIYTGSLLTTSREFCVKAVEKKYIHQSEFETILHGDFGEFGKVHVSRTTGLPPGLMAGTNVDNFPRRRGGWNCGHQLVAVDYSVVPQNVKDEVYSTTAYHAWALKNNKPIRHPSNVIQ